MTQSLIATSYSNICAIFNMIFHRWAEIPNSYVFKVYSKLKVFFLDKTKIRKKLIIIKTSRTLISHNIIMVKKIFKNWLKKKQLSYNSTGYLSFFSILNECIDFSESIWIFSIVFDVFENTLFCGKKWLLILNRSTVSSIIQQIFDYNMTSYKNISIIRNVITFIF